MMLSQLKTMRSVRGTSHLLALILLCFVGAPVSAQESRPDEEKVTFPTQPDVSIRRSNGQTIRVKLLEFNSERLRYLHPKAGKDVFLDWSTVRNLRTIEGEIDYSPGRDEYSTLLDASEKVGAEFSGLAGMQPGERRTSRHASPSGQVPSMASLSGELDRPASALKPENAPEVSDPIVALAHQYQCYKCQHIFGLPRPLQDQDACPKCGTVLHVATPQAALAQPANVTPANVQQPVIEEASSGWMNTPVKIAVFVALGAAFLFFVVGRQ